MRNTNTTMTNASNVTDVAQGQRSVEVVATLGDSVVDVSHVALTSDNRSRRPAYLMLGAAALFTLVAAGAFAKGVTTAAANERARVAWLQDPGQQAHDFRPQQLSPVYDWAALGGLSLGLVAFGLGIARLRSSGRRTSLTIGSDRGADICTADAPTALFPLVALRDGETRVTVMPGMRAELRAHGHRRDVEQLAALGLAKASSAQPGSWELAVPEVGILNVHVGPLRIGIRKVTAERSRLASFLGNFDARAGKFFGISAIAHMAVLALFYTLPPDAYSLTMDTDGAHARTRRIHVRATELAKRHQQDNAPSNSNTTPDSPKSQGGNTQHTATNPAHKPMSPGAKDAGHPRPKSRTDAITMVRKSGPLAVLLDNSSDLSLFNGGPMLAMNDDDITSLVLDDTGPGGDRFGGPNVGWNDIPGTVKSGRYDTIGDPNGDPNARPNSRNPGPQLSSRPTRDRAPRVEIKPPIVHGGLDKSIIRRHIKRKIARIQHCYERELTVNPDISGTVTTEFMVNGQGKVIYANASGIGSKRLESCISGVVATVKFPKPGDQSAVKVKYPFHFRRAG